MKALIGDIGRYALHDGPGIRTTVFFKGCTLRCPWCHNPELISPQPEILFYPDRCVACGDCEDRCPQAAIDLHRSERIDRVRCDVCGQCAEVCPSKALVTCGRPIHVEELMEVLLRDRLFYEASSGGVTLSGGEPTLQMAFAGRLLRRLKAENIHTALETNGCFSFGPFESQCLQYLDLIFYDLKICDPVRHRHVTGTDNRIIWSNLERLKGWKHGKVIPRIPIIPGYTAFRENLVEISKRIQKMGVESPVLLPYHPYGRSKAQYAGRGMDASLPQRPMDQDELIHWQRCIDNKAPSKTNNLEVNDAD